MKHYDSKRIRAAIHAFKPGAEIMLNDSETPDFRVFRQKMLAHLGRWHPGDRAVILTCLVKECGMSPSIAEDLASQHPLTLKNFHAFCELYG